MKKKDIINHISANRQQLINYSQQNHLFKVTKRYVYIDSVFEIIIVLS